MYGEAVNGKRKFATTVLAVMILCLCVEPKFCKRLQPVKQLDSPFLKNTVADYCVLVVRCGGKVICIMVDNYRVNQSLHSLMQAEPTKPWEAISPACD